MNLQLIIVILIGIVVAVILLRNIYRFFFVIDRKKNICGGCTGCSMSKEWKEDIHDPYRAYLQMTEELK